MPIVDTLRLKTRLSDNGMPEGQAQALVEELDEALTTAVTAQVATKVEVVELRGAINAVKEYMEERFEQVEKRFEQIDKRLDDLQTGMHQTNAEIKVLRWMGGTILVIQLGILVKLLFG